MKNQRRPRRRRGNVGILQPERTALKRTFRGKTPEQWRDLYAMAYDWGPDVGREVVED